MEEKLCWLYKERSAGVVIEWLSGKELKSLMGICEMYACDWMKFVLDRQTVISMYKEKQTLVYNLT